MNEVVSRSETVRDACLELLKAIRNNAAHTVLAHHLETISPQLERHIILQKKLRKRHLVEEFDALGKRLVAANKRH